jgi:hypothetical protein
VKSRGFECNCLVSTITAPALHRRLKWCIDYSVNFLTTRVFIAFLGGLALVANGQNAAKAPEPQWQPALSYGGAPECPEHVGSRIYRSGIASLSNTTAFITGTATHETGGCHATAEVQVDRAGESSHFKLATRSDRNFSLIDFSPDSKRVLLAHDYDEDKYRQYREVTIGLMSLADGRVEWHNAWDLFRWKDCDAMVEPQGFLSDGRIVIRARPTVSVGHTHPNCVNDIGLYALDLTGSLPVRLPDSTKVTRNGKSEKPPFQACSSDPDLVGSCFKVHGRISAYNGTPTLRIWRIGTDRLLGVDDEIPVPESLSRELDWDVNAYADLEVCPFTREQEGAMQRVCVESAEHIVVRKR